MTYAQCRDAALQIINQYSLGGTVIASSYNNQQDYINRIPNLVNDAMTYIATKIQGIVEEFIPTTTAWSGLWVKFTLPTGGLKLDRIIKIIDDELVPVTGYKFITDKTITIKAEDIADSVCTYRRMPTLLASPLDATVLDIDEANARAIPYYVAAFIVEQDDPQQYGFWFNQFERMLVVEDTQVESYITEDLYNAGEVY